MDETEATDEDLVLSAQKGDESAFAAIFDRYFSQIYGLSLIHI